MMESHTQLFLASRHSRRVGVRCLGHCCFLPRHSKQQMLFFRFYHRLCRARRKLSWRPTQSWLTCSTSVLSALYCDPISVSHATPTWRIHHPHPWGMSIHATPRQYCSYHLNWHGNAYFTIPKSLYHKTNKKSTIIMYIISSSFRSRHNCFLSGWKHRDRERTGIGARWTKRKQDMRADRRWSYSSAQRCRLCSMQATTGTHGSKQ